MVKWIGLREKTGHDKLGSLGVSDHAPQEAMVGNLRQVRKKVAGCLWVGHGVVPARVNQNEQRLFFTGA